MLSFFFNAPATPETYTLSLHDALPIFRPDCLCGIRLHVDDDVDGESVEPQRSTLMAIDLARPPLQSIDRKSTRLNSSHTVISYAVFCLKKKKKIKHDDTIVSCLIDSA